MSNQDLVKSWGQSDFPKECTPYKGNYYLSSYKDEIPSGYGPKTWRGYKPGLWRYLFECCRERECEIRVMQDYRKWENGRLHEALDKLHNAVVRFDLDELKNFERTFPETTKLLNEYATIEEVRTLEFNTQPIGGWEDGRPRFPGETREGFDSTTGKRTAGRPRGRSESPRRVVLAPFDGFLRCKIMHPRAFPYLKEKRVHMLDITPEGTDMVLVDGSRVRL